MCTPFRFLLKEGQYLVFALIQSEQRNKRYKFIDDECYLGMLNILTLISADYSYGTYFFRLLFVVNQELKMICYSKKSNYVKSTYCKFKRSRDLTEQATVCTFECRKMQITDSDVRETTKSTRKMQMFTLYKELQ